MRRHYSDAERQTRFGQASFPNAGPAEISNASLLSAVRAGTSLIRPDRPRRSPRVAENQIALAPSGRPYQTNRAGHVVAFGEHGEGCRAHAINRLVSDRWE